VGWWHFTHSYVRGNWRRENTTAPSLLTKSCHDIDVLLWLLCSPPSYRAVAAGQSEPPHIPSTVSSQGSLQYFKRSRKPVAAGAATNCLSCPIEDSCKYSAKRIYVGGNLAGLGAGNKGWPVKIVVPDIESYGTEEAGAKAILTELARDYDVTTPDDHVANRNWFGRCVYESDNDVCDEQVVSVAIHSLIPFRIFVTVCRIHATFPLTMSMQQVTITWDEDPLPSSHAAIHSGLSDPMGGRGAKTATFHMVAQTRKICERYTTLYGVDGEIYADSATITVHDFRNGQTTIHRPRFEDLGHGGGDAGLTRQFVLAVDKVKNYGWTTEKAQKELVGCTLEEVVRSHAMVFCAEEARRGRKVVNWADWWADKVEGKLADTD